MGLQTFFCRPYSGNIESQVWRIRNSYLFSIGIQDSFAVRSQIERLIYVVREVIRTWECKKLEETGELEHL